MTLLNDCVFNRADPLVVSVHIDMGSPAPAAGMRLYHEDTTQPHGLGAPVGTVYEVRGGEDDEHYTLYVRNAPGTDYVAWAAPGAPAVRLVAKTPSMSQT